MKQLLRVALLQAAVPGMRRSASVSTLKDMAGEGAAAKDVQLLGPLAHGKPKSRHALAGATFTNGSRHAPLVVHCSDGPSSAPPCELASEPLPVISLLPRSFKPPGAQECIVEGEAGEEGSGGLSIMTTVQRKPYRSTHSCGLLEAPSDAAPVLLSVLGKGSYGTVYKARWRNSDVSELLGPLT